MGVSYEIMGDLVVLTARERVTDEDFRKAFEAVIADPRFQKGSKVLTYDLESAYEPTTANPREAAATISSFMGHLAPRVAVVVSKEASIGLGRMIEKYCNEYGIEFCVFRDPNEAKEWLYPEKSRF
ncbi:MAG: hypothetical protein JSW58_05725 [Candidatus Latescibacterota bacterium]|nr:MAG: hypothetical protein JSW58_05725 [Candidatus Latescibacterota bacterium]